MTTFCIAFYESYLSTSMSKQPERGIFCLHFKGFKKRNAWYVGYRSLGGLERSVTLSDGRQAEIILFFVNPAVVTQRKKTVLNPISGEGEDWIHCQLRARKSVASREKATRQLINQM
jgi:hypothetical protein